MKLLHTKDAKHVLARAMICGMLLVLPSCGIPHLRHAAPAPDLPPTYKGVTSPDNSADLTVEEFYNDRLLTLLINQSVLDNRALKVLEEEVQIARNEILARRGAYLPFIGFGTSGGMDQYSKYTLPGASRRDDPFNGPESVTKFPKFLPNPVPDAKVGLDLNWQIDIWRQLRNARDAANRRYLGSIDKRNDLVIRLVAEVADSYYHLMALDKRLENLDRTIELQEQSLKIARARLEAGRGTELAVQRFLAEVKKNQSEKLIVNQDIIEAENKINFLVNRYPQPVERATAEFFDLTIHDLSVGVPSQLLQNRPDIREAERELEAAGLDILVARANFYPKVMITASAGFEAFNPVYIFTTPAASLMGSAAASLTAPLVNKNAIQAQYMTANARQLEALYNYQRVVLQGFTEVINRMAMVENYGKSIQLKREQLAALEESVNVAGKLFLAARVEYVDVLLAQRDLRDARMVMIDTKRQQLGAIVNAYQALGGGWQGFYGSGGAGHGGGHAGEPWVPPAPMPQPGAVP